jgi:STE24 endopeptidase
MLVPPSAMTSPADVARRLTRFGWGDVDVELHPDSREGLVRADYLLFRRKRIVTFWAKVFELIPSPYLDAILAHELGHFEHRHHLKMMSLQAVGWIAAIVGLTAGISGHLWGIIVWASMPLYFFVFLTWLARRFEFEADDFAIRMVGARAIKGALEWTSKLQPNEPKWWNHTYLHPQMRRRIKRLEGLP